MRPQADLRDAVPRYQALLYGRGVENVTISGENGTLDGGGTAWWRLWLTEPLYGRPHLIEFEESRGIRVRNVTLRNPGFWAVHFWKCEHVTVQFLTILVVPWDPPVRPTNTDGVNPDSSQHVLIEDSYFQTGDDAVAVKSGWDCFGREAGTASRNITIRRIVVRQTRGCNAAGVTIGSEMSAGVEDVLIEDSLFIHVGVAVEIKVGTGRGGFVRGVRVMRLVVEETNRGALVVMATYPEANPFCQELSPPAPMVSGITFQDVRILGPTHGNLVQLQGTPEVFLKDIRLRGISGSGPWVCSHVAGSASGNVPPACPALRPEGVVAEGVVAEGVVAEGAASAAAPRHERDVQWRNDGRCGLDFLVRAGTAGRCPTPEEFGAERGQPWRAEAEAWLASSPCCSSSGWCGGKEQHCGCPGCVDYRTRPAAAARAQGSGPPWSASPGFGGVGAAPEPPALGLTSPGALALAVGLCLVLARRCVPARPQAWCCRGPQVCLLGLLGWTVLQSLLLAMRPFKASGGIVSEGGQSAGPGGELAAALREAQPRRGAVQKLGAPTLVVSTSTAPGWARAGAATEERRRAADCLEGHAVDPKAFGAVGDGRADDTGAVLAALQHGGRCGGTVVIGPAGHSFLVMPGKLQVELHNVTIRFEGTLLGPSLQDWNPRLESWPPGSCAYGESHCSLSGGPSPEFARSRWALLHLQRCTGVTLQGQGPGGLRAPGRSFWRVRNSQPRVRGYCLLKLEGCRGVRVSGLRLEDSPMYQLVVMRCRDVRLEGLRITVADGGVGDAGPHNTDGVSIIASQGVELRASEIESGDDNVVIKEGSSGVYAEDLRLERGKGISIGSLGERGAGRQVVRDVAFRNVSLHLSAHGARIKTWRGSRGLVQNISFDDFHLRDVAFGILIDQLYCPLSQRPEGCAGGEGQGAIRVAGVRFRGFSGTYTQEERRVACVRCGDIRYEDIQLRRSSASFPSQSTR